MRFHALGLQHTITNKDYCACAFTQKVLKFCEMMVRQGHTVFHYGHQDSNVMCSEHITVIDRDLFNSIYGKHEHTKKLFTFDQNDEVHRTFNTNAIREIGLRKHPDDFLLAFWGSGHRTICYAHRDLIVVEPGIGYPGGHFAPYKVFESYAIYHAYQNLSKVGSCFVQSEEWENDAIIPNYFDPDDFEFSTQKDDYFLFVGRVGIAKGADMAIEMTRKLEKKLIIAGQNAEEGLKDIGYWPPPPHVELFGHANMEQKKRLMSKAKATICFSRFVEPFCGVHVESMLSGTPVITSDWGAFSEYNLDGITGFRCRTLEQCVQAGKDIGKIDPTVCYQWALKKFSMEAVSVKYQNYFSDILSRPAFVTACIDIQRKDRDFSFYEDGLKKLYDVLPNLTVYRKLEFWPHLSDVESIISKPEWISQSEWIKDSALTNRLYIPLTFAKLYLMLKARPTSNYIYWIDAGICNSYGGVPDMDKLPKDDFFMSSFPYYDNTEVHGLSKNVMYELGWKGNYVCRATLFGGTREGIKKVIVEFERIIAECVRRKSIGTEEAIFSILHSQRPDLITLYQMPNGDIKNLTSKFNYAQMDEEERPFATRLAEWISTELRPKNVLDVGCGPGMYVEELLKKGVSALGIEVSSEISKPYVLNKSLFDMNETAEVTMCLEVAEHIPEDQADTVVRKVSESAQKTLVWTAAVPGQGGVGHINCQPKEYWREKIEKYGFRYNEEMTRACVQFALSGYHMGWFVNNLQLFQKVGVTLTMTTCKRLEYFCRTIDALTLHCTDFKFIDRVLVVDDSSSDEDRKSMKERYPFIDLVCHDQKSHAHSLNIIRDEVNTEYLFMFEDDWVCQKDFSIRDALYFMKKNNIDNLRMNTIQMINGTVVFSPSKMSHEHKEWCQTKGYNLSSEVTHEGSGWPGFSLNPIILKKEVLDEPFDENIPTGFMEFDYSIRHAHKKWYGKDIGNVAHIGNESAYVLNDTRRWWDPA